jgi:biopolymer transport protein ExbD
MTTKFTPRQRAYIRKRTKYHEPDPSEEVGELNIVPFLDITVNIIVILLVVAASIAFFAQLEVQLPLLSQSGVGNRSDDGDPPFRLSLTLAENGVIVSGPNNKYAPGCQQAGTGRVITVPSRDGDYDWDALTTCAQRIKAEHPEAEEVRVSGNDQVEYQNFIRAVDAVRGSEVEPLFPDVILVAGIR